MVSVALCTRAFIRSPAPEGVLRATRATACLFPAYLVGAVGNPKKMRYMREYMPEKQVIIKSAFRRF